MNLVQQDNSSNTSNTTSSSSSDIQANTESLSIATPYAHDSGKYCGTKIDCMLMRPWLQQNLLKTKENVKMTNLINPERAIPAVYNEVIGLDAIIAGGAVTDKYFGLQAKDIDVFAPVTRELLMFVEKHKFEMVKNDIGESVDIFDSYGRSRMNTRDNIECVYKGFILGYPVDIVAVKEDDARKHIDTFDLNIKRAYYDGRYHYSKEFMMDVTNNTITPNVYEATGYIRAKQYADKYGMEVSDLFEMSRHYVAYLKEHDKLSFIPKKYREYAEATDFGTYDEHIVQAADLFRVVHADMISSKRMKKFHALAKMMSKDIQSYHPLTREHLTIDIASGNLGTFRITATRLYRSVFTDEAKELVAPLVFISDEQFNDGVVKDGSNRQVRINKYINKLIKKLPEWKMSFDILSKLVETRATKSKATVEFSASTKDLLQISTHKGWSSCQKWYFDEVTPHNVGVLGNLGGATAVGILKTDDSDKWGGRFLVRIGEDNALWLEGIYTHRSEFGEDQMSILNQVSDQLRELGYTVFTRNVDGLKFKSLPMEFRPYNDTHLNMKTKGGRYFFESHIPLKPMPIVRDIAGVIRVADNNEDLPDFMQGMDADGDRLPF